MEYQLGSYVEARRLFQEGVWADPGNKDVVFIFQVRRRVLTGNICRVLTWIEWSKEAYYVHFIFPRHRQPQPQRAGVNIFSALAFNASCSQRQH